MLKIKFNINEFTIIFSEEIRRKINAENISRLSPPSSASIFQFQHLCLSVSALSIFCFSPLSFSFSTLSFLFQPSVFSFSALFCFSASFLLFSLFSASFFLFCSALPFSVKCLFSFSFSASFLCFSFSPTFLKANTKLVAAQKAQNVLLQKPQRVAPFSSAPLFFCACLLLFFLANF